MYLYFYLLHKYREGFCFRVLYCEAEDDEFFMFYVYITELCTESFNWRASYKQNNQIPTALPLLPCFGYISNFL